MFFSGYPSVGFPWWCAYIVRAFSSLKFFPESEMGSPTSLPYDFFYTISRLLSFVHV